MTTTEMTFSDALRKLADIYEAHPTLEKPSFSIYASDTRDNAAKTLRALLPAEKEYDGQIFRISKKIGPIDLSFVFLRSTVCTPRVIGKRRVEASIIPGQIIPEQVIPAHEEDVIEWACDDSLLAPQPDATDSTIQEPV